MKRSPVTDAIRAGAYKIVEEDLRALGLCGMWLNDEKPLVEMEMHVEGYVHMVRGVSILDAVDQACAAREVAT